jgi:drug/metabolite transporter (DMT)-like permease
VASRPSAGTPAGPPDRVTLLAFVGVVIFGGLNAVAARQTVLELAPLWSAAARFLVAGLIFTVLARAGGRGFPSRRGFVGAIAYGLIGLAASFGLIYPALRTVQAGTAAVLIALSPLMTYALAVVQRQEAFRPQAMVGAAIALLGIGVVFVDQLEAAVPLELLALIVLGTLCLSESAIVAKWIPRGDPNTINAIAMMSAAIVLLGASVATGEVRDVPHQTGTWLALGYVTIFGTVVMFGLYLVGIQRWTASAMSYSTLLLPFVGVSAATIVTGESFSLAFVIGGVVMLAGVYLGAFGISRPRRSTATSMPECLPVEDCPEEAIEPASSPAGP